MMKDYRVTVKVRNNNILKAIERVGGAPGKKWCDSVGLQYGTVNDLINLVVSPLKSDGSLTKCAEKLCDVIWVSPDDLWSKHQLRPLERNFSEIEMSAREVAGLIESNGEQVADALISVHHDDMKRVLSESLKGLSDRRRKVLEMRFFDDMPLEDIGKEMNVTMERIRQIEAAALRDLRDVKKNGRLTHLLEDGFVSEIGAEFH